MTNMVQVVSHYLAHGEKKPVAVHSLVLVSWLGSNHKYRLLDEQFTIEEETMAKALGSFEKNPLIKDELDSTSDPPPAVSVLNRRYLEEHACALSFHHSGPYFAFRRSRRDCHAAAPRSFSTGTPENERGKG
ncbi:hypothetical protein EDC04DRAFT_2634585 [Pisolithus marmoratus]|nr:hypothetical protein EDC04DRAFT_2634585 [Pisolithus marmoratus]